MTLYHTIVNKYIIFVCLIFAKARLSENNLTNLFTIYSILFSTASMGSYDISHSLPTRKISKVS